MRATSSATRNSPSRTPLSGATVAPVPDARSTLARARLAALRHAVGITGQDRSAKRRLARHCRLLIADCRLNCSDFESAICNLKSAISSATRFTCGGTSPHSSSADSKSERRRCRARRQEVPLRQQRARLRDLPGAARRDQHPRQPRMQRQTSDLLTHRGQVRRAAVHPTRLTPIAPSRSSSVIAASSASSRGRSNHSNVARIAAPRDDVEHRARQIDAVNLRLAMRPQPVARIPQPQHDARRQAPGAAGALIGRVGGDALGLEAVDAALGVVPRDLVQPGVDDRRRRPERSARSRRCWSRR